MYNSAMENLRIKRKDFEVNQIVSLDTFICSYKNKTYFIKKYEPGSEFLYMAKKLIKSNINQPKTLIIDKKTGYVVKEYLDGTLMSDYILDHDFDENIYKQIFKNSYMARSAGLNLDYSLDKWMLVEDKLFYIGSYCEKYDPKFDFTKTKMREWFFTDELAKYYKSIGVLFDKNRIKNVYSVNKEMVLMTCKYYL